MHNFVQRIMRGVIFCSVCIAITACAGNDLADGEQAPQTTVQKSDEGLPRIDAIRLRVARNALANGDYNTAIRFFESVRASSPTHTAPLIGIANAHMAAGSLKEAIVAYRDVLELDPNHDEALDGIGRALVSAAQYSEAIEYFNRLLARAPSAALHNRLGVAHDLMGDGEGAQKHYRAALALDPEAISPRNNLALSLAISQSYAEAIEQMERVAAHPQATAKHRQNLAFVYGMAGENDVAAAAFAENGLTASEIARKRALYKRIRALAKAGNHAEILEYLRNGKEIGDPAMADNLAEPTDPSQTMASATAGGKSLRQDMKPSAPMGKVVPPKALVKQKVLPTRTTPKSTAAARISRPAKLAPKPGKAGPAVVGFYRIQLAAYRTARSAARGVEILRSILRDSTPDLEILVRQVRSKEKRAIDYRIRTPQVPNYDAASLQCTKIEAAGHPDCLVILHNPRVWAAVDLSGSSLVSESSPVTGPPSYRVQLASFRTARGAARGQAILRKLLGDRAVSLDILVRQARRAGPAAFDYQIRTGPVKTRTQGIGLCEALKQAGHPGCLVVRHNDALWRNLAEAAARDKASPGSPQGQTRAPAPGQPTAPAKGQTKAPPPGEIKAPAKGHTEVRTKGPTKDVVSNSPQVGDPVQLTAKVTARAPTPSQDSKRQSYRVQLASFRTERGAARGQAILRKLLGDRAVSLDILVRRARNAGPVAFDYQIRTGPVKTRAEGAGLCAALKKAGHPQCFVVRHNELLWNTLANKAGERDKASLDSPEGHTRDVVSISRQAADPARQTIVLPSSAVMEAGLAAAAGPDGMAGLPVIPMADI